MLLSTVPRNHPLAQRSSVRLADLDQQPYIERINCEVWRSQPRLFELAGVHPRVICRANHEEWVIALITAGLGISIVPVWNHLTEIVYIPLSDQTLCRVVSLRWRSQQGSELVEQLRAFLSSHAW